jgi:hypothetical protein
MARATTREWTQDRFGPPSILSTPNLTRADFLCALHDTKGWTANGLLPTAPDFSLKDFGHAPKSTCAYFVWLQGSTYDTMNGGKPICGGLVS